MVCDFIKNRSIDPFVNIFRPQAVTKRAGRKKDASNAQAATTGGGQPQVKKATFESTKKKEVGVSDLTLISKISNEAINDNLKKRFENGEIYVWELGTKDREGIRTVLIVIVDLYRPCAGIRQSISRL